MTSPAGAAVDLDDVEAMRRVDVDDMLGTVLALGEQCRAGYAIGRELEPLPTVDDVTSIVFCGMGGSAIAGDVLRVLAAERVHAPVVVIRAPELPAFVTHETLAIVSSYSGETVETLALFEEAHARGARVVALTSGGELARRAEEEAVPVARVPGGLMPRAAFGHLAMATLGMLETAGLLAHVGDDLDEALEQLGRIAEANAPAIATDRAPAKALARAIGDRSVVVWGADGVG